MVTYGYAWLYPRCGSPVQEPATAGPTLALRPSCAGPDRLVGLCQGSEHRWEVAWKQTGELGQAVIPNQFSRDFMVIYSG